MSYYKDLREYISTLEENNKLVRIKRLINKDTELHPLVRWQFRGLQESERKAFLFERITDSQNRNYSIPVLVGSHAGSSEIFALGMKCKPEEITGKLTLAQLKPIPPRVVELGAVYEVIHRGEELLSHGGLEEFPIPVSTPGFDNAPYLTAANWVSKDPEDGSVNIGNYRGMLKSKTKLGVNCNAPQHMRIHWEKCRARGIPLQAAIVIGAAPSIGYVATTKFPYGTNEYAIAGAIAGDPVELVKCKTVDLDVPATAEIVIEGELPTEYEEEEGPFGEFTGFMASGQWSPFFNVSCIMHRKEPIFSSFISQFPPSESSKMRQYSTQSVLFKYLKHDSNIPGIIDVAVHESGGSSKYVVIRMKKTHGSQSWQALNAAAAILPHVGKFVIVVDDDIDPWDADSVNWALSWRVQPHRDIRITMGKVSALDPSSAPPDDPLKKYPPPHGDSAILIDATRKWAYPPVALPAKDYMERARKIWEAEGLPPLLPKLPWYGWSLGHWSSENEEEASRAVKGQYVITGQEMEKRKRKVEP